MCELSTPSRRDDRATVRTTPAARRRLWQIPDRYHCSLIGTCLSLDEVRALARKLGVRPDATATDHLLHVTLVGAAGERDAGGRAIHKCLDRKFADALRRFTTARDEAGLSLLWDQTYADDDLAGAYWALMSHPAASPALMSRAYGQVHMLAHVATTALRSVRAERDEAALRAAEARSDLASERERNRTRLAALESEALELRRKAVSAEATAGALAAARGRIQALEADTRLRKAEQALARSDKTEARLRQSEREAIEWKALALRCGDRIQALETALGEAERERTALESELTALLDESARPACAGDAANCPRFDLNGRCVAYVGGLDRLCPPMRSLTERYNGRFLHHDGGLHTSIARLESILDQADLVLCPLDCVSHDACERLKRHCKHRGKPFLFLRTSSLSAFAEGLRRSAG